MSRIRPDRVHFNGSAVFGKPCRRCGSMERFVANDHCAPCSRAKGRARIESTRLQRSFSHARKRARETGQEFNISLESLPVPELCPVFGTPIKRPSLMLLDRSRGYTRDNVRVVSWRAHQLKANGSLSELAQLVCFLTRATRSASDEGRRDLIGRS